jgi:hypothetical protein
MRITDILSRVGGLQSIARELGINETEAASGAEALAPAILGGLKKQTQSQPAGLADLGGLLGKLGGGGLLDNVVAPEPTDVSRGNNVLGALFGSKDVSRAVAQNAASQSGLAPDLLKKMLPMVAMLITGYMAKQHATGAPTTGGDGGLGGMLGSLIGGQVASSAAQGLGSMVDLNGDGNALDDILRMVGKPVR